MKQVKRLALLVLVTVSLNCADKANKEEVVLKKTAVQEEVKKEKLANFDVNQLIDAAKKARENAYCPYSKFKVGAALLTESGKIYTGVNVENASYGLTNCAERTAIFKAVSEGDKKIIAIAIVLDAPDFGAPCGACRQVIHEFGKDAVVIMATVNGNHKIETMPSLLTYAFNLD